MPAAVYVGDGKIAVEEVPCPEPGPGEVLVEIAECGICGSDLHMVLERYAKPGAILGHEWSGVVASAPAAPAGLPVIESWAIRPRGVACAGPADGVALRCASRVPRRRLLGYRGAFCRYKTVAADGLIRIPDSLPTRVAALTEPTAIRCTHYGLAASAPMIECWSRARARSGCSSSPCCAPRGSPTSP